MDLQVARQYEGLSVAIEASEIVQKCVHCGFCNATCPTYQLLGDELDGPRGRIYLMKSFLEGNDISGITRRHLDRCLTCRACETTCPSGVRYGRLLEIGRDIMEREYRRPLGDRLVRMFLRKTLADRRAFYVLLQLGRMIKPLLPKRWAEAIPGHRSGQRIPPVRHVRRMLLLEGCVQPALAPSINASAKRVLDIAGISLVEPTKAGCCGALSLHLGGTIEAKKLARRNIDAWWPEIQKGCEAIIMTASGCGVTVRDYGQLLGEDKTYAEKANKISSMVRDLSEIISCEQPNGLRQGNRRRVAFHSPCTLQHGQKIRDSIEKILQNHGWEIAFVRDQHICCGSAGTYSILQKRIANQLKEKKLKALNENDPEIIASANIGCLIHLEKSSDIPVRHWIELLDPANSYV